MSQQDIIDAGFDYDNISNRLYAIVRLSNGVGDVTFNNKTWLGNGWFQEPSSPAADDKIDCASADIILTGVDQTCASIVMNTHGVNQKSELYLGFNVSGTIFGQLVWEGVFSDADIANAPEETSCTIHYDTELIELERPKMNRYNAETQKNYYPDDTGFKYLDGLMDKEWQFGRTKEELETKQRKAEKKAKRAEAKKRGKK